MISPNYHPFYTVQPGCTSETRQPRIANGLTSPLKPETHPFKTLPSQQFDAAQFNKQGSPPDKQQQDNNPGWTKEEVTTAVQQKLLEQLIEQWMKFQENLPEQLMRLLTQIGSREIKVE